MAHAGLSHSAHHSYYHSHYYGSSYDDEESEGFWLLIGLISFAVLLFVVFVVPDVQKSQIAGKEKINAKYEITDYVITQSSAMNVEAYFINEDQLETSLEEFYDDTGVQLVVYVALDNYSQNDALNLYYELFNDEYHALIIVTPTWSLNDEYGTADYVVGDKVDGILSDTAMRYLISEKLDYSHDGAKWKKGLAEFTNFLLS